MKRPIFKRFYISSVEAECLKPEDPRIRMTAVYFYNKMGQSASGIICIRLMGNLGHLRGNSCAIKPIARSCGSISSRSGHPSLLSFLKGYISNLSVAFAPDEPVCRRHRSRWGAGEENLLPSAYPMDQDTEIHTMHDGFELTFTQTRRSASAMVQSYQMEITYIYQSSYGSSEVDATRPKFNRLWSRGRTKGHPQTGLLQIGRVHELKCPDPKRQVENLFNPAAYYTLNQTQRNLPRLREFLRIHRPGVLNGNRH